VARDHRAEFTDFAAARQRSLLRAAYLMVGDEGLAQDLVQEALTKTYVAWPRLRRTESAEAYARRAITTTAIGWFRRKGWYAERPTGAPPEREAAGHAERVTRDEWLWQGLLRLPARQRAAVVLRYYEDLTEAQTAEAMGCAVGTVKSQVSAALRSLRDHLGDDPGDDPLAALLPAPSPSVQTTTGGTR
jgi:RNA polymerase sigma-70 factor (sigma-E family)